MSNVTELRTNEVIVRLEETELRANLDVPENARGIVAFAHGSGSSRFSPRNRAVAKTLNGGGLATLLMDLLTSEEQRVDERTGHLRFDIPLLARRMSGAVDWLRAQENLSSLKIGLFGASTGAAAALVSAAERPDSVAAVVSRGGRPDLAGEYLPLVKAPVLLIVGGYDRPVIEMNKEAQTELQCENEMIIIPGATHLFEEPGKLEQVADIAKNWFQRHLAA